jgi:hypothetical protein
MLYRRSGIRTHNVTESPVKTADLSQVTDSYTDIRYKVRFYIALVFRCISVIIMQTPSIERSFE